jgi:predicted transcriptional regulator
MREQKVREIMTTPVVTAMPQMSLRELGQLLMRTKVSGVPVVDAEGRPIGVVSKSDIIDRIQNDEEAFGMEKLFYRTAFGVRGELGPGFHLDPGDETTVEELMTPLVLSVSADTPISLAARMMAFEQVHRVIVTDEGRMVGILTTMDIVRAVGGLKSEGRPGVEAR